ncbi:ABCB family ABC transporter ATP-binding protein/permease [Gynuella sunshinyii]|uniref:ABC-type transport system involved in Fe-S cluster assembly, permease and ATPase component n=1 Tax=Gynuella sunshinyii YC6258 TaxID=1445510 RepID=A0A0C5VZN4_9GAMM|nr:ABC transporter ATP-binding protein/permease [Gynuella sunshinyii]AJQ95889.1 ABC-type transport system involved in Fe-S cluster assembly, permease and ATPase component [Gynuella sunshinyii YC6258]
MSSRRTGIYEEAPNRDVNVWSVLKGLWPYLMDYRGRVTAALGLLILAKIATVTMPWVLKHIVDALDTGKVQIVVVPLALLLAYGAVRFASVFLGELRDAIFSRVTEHTMRKTSLAVFEHLHKLELDFHLNRQTGGVSRDIDRGTSGISFLLRTVVFNILPTLFELLMVAGILFINFNVLYALITVSSVLLYIFFTIHTTEWRTRFVREANQLDSRSNARAIDSLLNYETVKYFNNEAYESSQYDHHLQQWEAARMRNRLSLAALNSGQAFIVSAAVTVMMIMAGYDVADGQVSLGDLVMINAYMIQLFIPLNFLGFVYREVRRAVADVENMLGLLNRKPAVTDSDNATDLVVHQGHVVFENVCFGYSTERTIIHDLNLEILPGQKVALVGHSGSGKSTLARLMFRFYDPSSGRIKVDDQCIADVTQSSLRSHIGVVPQDTVLFNDTIFNNVWYGNTRASDADVWRAIEMAHLGEFVRQLPKGADTLVGERGLKVSGGEKQRIAIARTLLKDPPILIFDEATSALDSRAEKAILDAMEELSRNRTTVVIAHRLSTIVNADLIVVLEHGRVCELGTHGELLVSGGPYAELWQMQQQQESEKLLKK